MTAERRFVPADPNLDPQANIIKQEMSQLLEEWGLSGIRVLAKLPNQQIESFVQTLRERIKQT